MPKQVYRIRHGELRAEGQATMARIIAELPSGSRITDYVSLGVIAKTFPLAKILAILKATEKNSVRQRDLPA
jgi:hypothetical protein